MNRTIVDLSLQRVSSRKSVADQASNSQNFTGNVDTDKPVHRGTPNYRSSTLSCVASEPILHAMSPATKRLHCLEQLPEQAAAENFDDMRICAEVPSLSLSPLSRRRTGSVRRLTVNAVSEASATLRPSRCQRTPSCGSSPAPSRKRPLMDYWAAIRSQTRTKQLEVAIQKNRDTQGEGSKERKMHSQGYACTVPIGDGPMGGAEVEVSPDDCIATLSKLPHMHQDDWQGLRVLGVGRDVNAFLQDLRSRCSGVDWSATCGIAPAQSPHSRRPSLVGGHSDVHEAQVLHFNLDMLADHMSRDFRGRRFDLIVSHDALCHVKDPLGVVCLTFELLRPGGVMLFIEPSHPLTGSLPYTDHKTYHTTSSSGDINLVRLHGDLLPRWVKDGAHVFSSCQRGPPFRHVLALRRPPASSGLQLSLPTALCPGGAIVADRLVAQWPGSRLRQARSGDMEHSVVVPPAASFCEWLAAH
mmetsp:Transcript_24791/g.45515  ORF Transcript_24791/g.45515 Transcript_24791/m.45515 type:complete len:470 (+) Transcript_24791:60-1469(+)